MADTVSAASQGESAVSQQNTRIAAVLLGLALAASVLCIAAFVIALSVPGPNFWLLVAGGALGAAILVWVTALTVAFIARRPMRWLHLIIAGLLAVAVMATIAIGRAGVFVAWRFDTFARHSLENALRDQSRDPQSVAGFAVIEVVRDEDGILYGVSRGILETCGFLHTRQPQTPPRKNAQDLGDGWSAVCVADESF